MIVHLNRPWTIMLLSLTVLLAAPLAATSRVRLSTGQLVSRSDLIVVGKLSRRKKDIDSCNAVATLTIARVLKGDPGLQEVTVKFRTCPSAFNRKPDFAFQGGEEGLWLLRRDATAKEPVYRGVSHKLLIRMDTLNARQRKSKVDQIARIIKDTQPRKAKLAEVIEQSLAAGGDVRYFHVRGSFQKRRRIGNEIVNWVLKDGSDTVLRCWRGEILKAAKESARTGKELDLEIRARVYGGGKKRFVRATALRVLRAPKNGSGPQASTAAALQQVLEKMLNVDPESGEALARVIPVYHELNREADATAAVFRLRKLHASGKHQAVSFLREAFKLAERFGGSAPVDRTVRVIEYFKPTAGKTTSRWPVLWEFRVFDEDKKLIRKVFLEISLIVSKNRGETIYSLDENHLENGRFVFHAAYGFLPEVPSYDKLKAMAVDVLQGKRKWTSRSGRPASRYGPGKISVR